MVKKLTGLVVGLVLVVVLGVVGFAVLSPNSVFGVSTESRDSKVITAVETQEQVVLLSASTQGLHEESSQGSWFDKWIPGLGRTEFVQYSYRAKLGIEGGDVTIEQTGDDRYRISVPEFIFIGYDNVEFKTAVRKNGVLSWLTPDIDTAEAINKILSDDAKAEEIDVNQDLLRKQTTAFYTGIVNGIDDDIELEFTFL